MIVKEDYIICNKCNYKFERDRMLRFCSNCFVCSGCEIYYCPSCDEEIVITPVRRIKSASDKNEGDNSNYLNT
jgi:hypothetical protein